MDRITGPDYLVEILYAWIGFELGPCFGLSLKLPFIRQRKLGLRLTLTQRGLIRRPHQPKTHFAKPLANLQQRSCPTGSPGR